jgi:hypothetical protein
MIQIKYKLLFELEILHSFYRNGKCPDFNLTPTEACKAALNSFGLRFLPTMFGGKVYAKVKPDETLQSPLAEGCKFSFSMLLNNRSFDNFSKINALKPRGSHYYFSNLTSNLSSDSVPLLVSNSTSKVVSDADLLPFVSHSFSYSHKSTTDFQDGLLQFPDSGEVFTQRLTNYNNHFNFSFDLEKSRGGRASFFVEGVEKASMYVLSRGEPRDLFGTIEIYYQSTLPPEFQFQNNNLTISPKKYQIPFSHNSTRWRYIIDRRFNQSVSEVVVNKANGSPIPFTAATNAPPNHFILASNQPIALQEDPITGIQLRDQTDKVLIANLPNPTMQLVTTEGSETFSDILITI